MDSVRDGIMELSTNKDSGQTTVEYILLFVVVISLVMTVYKSAAFKRMFGDQGEVGLKIKAQNEFSYRHAFHISGSEREPLPDIPRDNKDILNHPSYVDVSSAGDSRFFGPKDPYGQ
jgi:hypothetical protein